MEGHADSERVAFSTTRPSTSSVWSLPGSINVSSAAVRVVVTILLAYPLAYIYRRLFYYSSPRTKHLLFAACGICLTTFNFGRGVGHTLLPVVVCWTLMRLWGGTLLSVLLSFAIFMTHLVIGYHTSGRALLEYTWTLPHCILTQRLIGLMWDLYDGQRPAASLSKSQRKSAVYVPPSFLELLGYSFFFNSFLCGPQFPLTRYRQFVANQIGSDQKGRPLNSAKAATFRLLTGVFVLIAQTLAWQYVNSELLLSQRFENYAFHDRVMTVAIWGRLVMARYQGVWLLVEGSCILSGVAHDGFDSTGRPIFDGLRSVHMSRFELAYKFEQIIQSYNCMTNRWVAEYVYKRVKFLGSKTYSHIVVLLFLAFWHGTYSGYFVTFAWEFICIATERSCVSALGRFPLTLGVINHPWVFPFVWILLKIWVVVHLGFGYLPFVLLTHEKWNLVYGRLYYFGFANIISAYVLSRLVLSFVPKKSSKVQFENDVSKKVS